jgi:hypothetical protein
MVSEASLTATLSRSARCSTVDRTGLLCTPGSVDEGAKAVASLLNDEARRTRLGNAALEEAPERYMCDAHVTWIREALRP